MESEILPRIEKETRRKLTYDNLSEDRQIHWVNSPEHGGLTFLVITESSLRRAVAFGFLSEIQNLFTQKFNNYDFGAMPKKGAKSFNSDLKDLMVEYPTIGGGGDDAIGSARREIDDARDIMAENIRKVWERGERISLLVGKTDQLGGSSREFRVRSRGLKRKMWWKNIKLMALLALVLFLIIMAIVIAVKN